MLKMPDTKCKFFSVKHSTKIQGTRYMPSVCYPLSTGLRAAIEKMAADDMARIYPEKVRFVTGVPYPVKKPETGAATSRRSSASAPDTNAGNAVKQDIKAAPAVPEKRQGRRQGRSDYTSRADREFN